MEYLNWIADHWLITIVLAMIVSGAMQNMIRAFVRGCVDARTKK
jgi:lipoprotein signal peptidase